MIGSLVSVGECMVELARGGDGRFGLAYGGDTFNTAVYAARMGVPTAYATALGDDAYSNGIAALGESEGVDMALAPRRAGRMPGLYLIETNEQGERSFFYWRDRAPARELFEDAGAAGVVTARMAQAALAYFSGITLSLYSPAGLDAFERALRAAKQAGARIAFDGNFRPRGWGGDKERARGVFQRFLALCDVALPTFDDEQALWGDSSPVDTIARLGALGVGEVAVKNGADGALVRAGGSEFVAPVPERIIAVDTTAAGDSFNAGYLAGRLRGAEPADSALLGHRLAVGVIGHRGAIVPKEATRALVETARATNI